MIVYAISGNLLGSTSYNAVQRALFAPPEVGVRMLVRRGARVEIAPPGNVEIRRARLPGIPGLWAAVAGGALTARRRGVRALATNRSSLAVVAWALRPIGGYAWVLDAWDSPHKELHADAGERGPRAALRRLASRAKVAGVARVARRADLVLASVRAEALTRYRVPPERLRTFTNAIDLPSLRAPGGERREPGSICFVDRGFSPDRGLATLAAALERLAAGGIEARVRLAGELPAAGLRLIAASPAAERFDVLGELSHREAQELMARSQVGVIPFEDNEDLAHTYPVKLLEYMALGAVVVASDLPGVREVVTDREHALLVPPGDPAALARALAEALDDPGLRGRLRAAARERVTELDARQKIAAIYREIGGVEPGRRA